MTLCKQLVTVAGCIAYLVAEVHCSRAVRRAHGSLLLQLPAHSPSQSVQPACGQSCSGRNLQHAAGKWVASAGAL
jgi:hypothetical protein